MIVSRFCQRMVRLLVAVVAVAVAGEAVASPARRLARRGVVVVPVPGPPAVVPAPIVIGPMPLPRRLVAGPAAPLFVPGPAAVIVREQLRARVPQPAVAPAVPAAAAAAKPAPVSPESSLAGPAAAEEIAAPLPAPAGDTTTASSTLPGDDQTAFTPAWYASHPQAWRPAQPADWWRGADLATVTAWLGQPVSAAAGAVAGTAGAVTPAGADEVGPDGLKSVLVLPAGHANAAAAAGGDWLPLGVFAVVTQADGQPVAQPHNYQQLAVDRQGVIKGNFYDAISDTLQPITGTVDRDTLTASWAVGTGGSRFTAPIRGFTAPPRTVTVASGGASRELQLLPVQKPQ